MLNRLLIGAVGAAGATILGAPGIAAADPPPMPDINSYPPAKPSEYAVQDGAWYAFTRARRRDVRAGQAVRRVRLQRPDSRSAERRQHGHRHGVGLARVRQLPPSRSTASFDGAKPLPPNTRLSFRTVSCGTDGVTTACRNAADQSGFVISPAGSYTFG